jgi:hypothetical protein
MMHEELFPTFRALRVLRGFKFPCHFGKAGEHWHWFILHSSHYATLRIAKFPSSEYPHAGIGRGFKMPYLSQLISAAGIKCAQLLTWAPRFRLPNTNLFRRDAEVHTRAEDRLVYEAGG